MRRFVTLSLVAALTASVSPSAAAAARKHTCRVPKGATDIIRGSRVTMWTEKRSGAVRACHRTTGRTVAVWTPLDEDSFGYWSRALRGAVNSDMAAVVSYNGDKYWREEMAITVVNVRRRKLKSVGRSLWELNPAWPPAARPDGPRASPGSCCPRWGRAR